MKKFVKILLISIIAIFAFLFIIPYLIPSTISYQITQVINKNIKGEVKFKNVSLSFFSHFPSLTLNLDSFVLKGAAPFEKDTLISTKKLSLGINLLSLLGNQVKVDEFYLDEANINVLVDEQGRANYNVYESKAPTATSNDTSNTAIKIEGIFIQHSNLTYNDKSMPMLLRSKNLNYTGKGDFSKAIFDLKSKLSIGAMDLYYANTPYLLNKKLDAKLITKVNTNSLDLVFDDNNLVINSLPIRFVGRFSFIKDGYDMDFKTDAKETDLQNIFTALPAEIADRLKKTKIKGYAEINAALKGQYIAKTNTMPNLTFNMKVRDGSISNPNAPEPISNLFLNLQTKLPGLNPDSLYFNMDSLYFNIGKDFVASVTKIKGLKEPEIYTNTRADIDLEKWAKVVNMDSLQLKGRFLLHLSANGKYSKNVVKSGLRKVDTVIATIPVFSLSSTLKNGYFKFAALPAAVDKINFAIKGSNTDGNYKNTSLIMRDIDIVSMRNFLKGHLVLHTSNHTPLDVQLKAALNFADVKNIYPIKGLELSGIMNLAIQSKGPYDKTKKLFPVTQATVKLSEGRIKTPYFNEALEHIQIDAHLVNRDATLKNTGLNIKPISFTMAGQSFLLKADVNNFENIAYHVSSKGTIDVGKMYKFFAVKGYQVNGLIMADVDFKGLQSDVLKQRYSKLNNSGKMSIQNLNLQSDLFPKSFLIKNGIFSFVQDKMNFEEFKATYGSSDFKLNGALRNVINYALNDKAKLTGTFKLESDKIAADEFMVYAATDQDNSTATTSNSGVILIPDNLNVTLHANAAHILYNGLDIRNGQGSMVVNKGILSLKKTSFNLAGAKVAMDASYQSINPQKADFDFKVLAKEFDIARAYKEVPLFREMATSASKVKGIVGLDYQMAGKLDGEMSPVLPSLKGGGVLSLKKVSLMGFKMMNALSKATKRDSLNNPDLSDVQIKSTLKNNILTIEQTKLRIAGFRPRFEGQVSLTGKLNLKGRLGLPPFGILGIPLSITGTQEKPIVKLKRNKEGKLEETAP
ncbi:AsmA family protein [Pedobacter sp. MC2016-14]|uniref:AsmA family protein n=1 Tax=Pedobacter sp. MC2016-14 TaxID=2897327 RepID=UPI001E5D7AF4|nr:AsmA family protein [Pedobacter sp. MC2016-14]MCD0489119.1 AsmA family protein [Pedobacter sp. MC2016-14]